MENHEDEFNIQYSNSIEECSDNHIDSDSGSVNTLDDDEEKGRDTNEARICETPVIGMETLKSNLDSSSMVQYSELSHNAQRIIVKGTRNDQPYAFVKSELLKFEEKVESRKNLEHRHAGTNDNINSHNHENDDGENMRLCDPKIQKSVGRDYVEPTPHVDALQKQSYADELQKKSH
ncbi:hypothetical protein QYF36_009946 [Acer negundo]|nr:hypothetical protein QYF36_009946 [Acer negundo]